ncbi:MAG: cysteine--tRNA ligase [Pseudomonadota bacterium]|nr:cysteine--tRNA ligase [Arenicellales bacterium]MDP6920093.1 cysteine--tRNA ligase [Arenicellales bacterium]MEC9371959.1 cysteine--tRNA ligase [Pseudomonadota bacterium]
MTDPTPGSIVLYNSLTRRKEQLETLHPDRVGMYVCGPTVYNLAHIGNARPAVIFDVLARLLRLFYSDVTYVRNITDVDDKINAASIETGEKIGVITERFTTAYHQDMAALNIAQPDAEPRVTDHIEQIVNMIESLVEREHAYLAEGHVLFDIKSFPEYGELSGRSTDDMIAGARVEIAPYKRDPMDFVLWKPSTPELPGWESPWGRGRPGWHIECSAMSESHLGETIDIHGGGRDLIFPHHENEIAQSICAHGGSPYCRMWVHNGFVTVEGQKMSKSLGNVLLVRDLLDEAPAEAIRLALLSTHYRAALDWTTVRLDEAKRTLVKWYRALELCSTDSLSDEAVPDSEVVCALCDDLNTSVVFARIHQLVGDLGQSSDPVEQAKLKHTIVASADVLGLLQQDPTTALAALTASSLKRNDIDAVWIEQRIEDRRLARLNKDFEQADNIRDELSAAGIRIEDSADGTTWHPL